MGASNCPGPPCSPRARTTPCEHCLDIHIRGAKLAGVTRDELAELNSNDSTTGMRRCQGTPLISATCAIRHTLVHCQTTAHCASPNLCTLAAGRHARGSTCRSSKRCWSASFIP
ncbi:MAG: carboxymuconolactone decarboxylase family protein [Rhizobacter sp.]|nr:carboxymuconolactone decarboxylase family protein [Rhizobacter sp.]